MKIILTHDADSVRQPFRHIWSRRSRFTRRDLLASALGLRNLYNNIADIVSLEGELGFRSTFFIPVFLFDIHEVIDTLLEIRGEGWEVQLHYVHEANPQFQGLFRMQMSFFNELLGSAQGVRCHGLRVNDDLLNLFRREGLRYDSSMRGETAGTYDPYTATSNGLVEIPIGVMDADLFGRLHLSEAAAWRYILRKIEAAESSGARYFTLLFHQEAYRMKGGRLYRRLLRHLADSGYNGIKCIDAYGEAGPVTRGKPRPQSTILKQQ